MNNFLFYDTIGSRLFPEFWYTFTKMNEKENFPVGTKVQHKFNGVQGTVVSEKCFGKCVGRHNVMLQLTCGLQFEVSPHALRKVEEFTG